MPEHPDTSTPRTATAHPAGDGDAALRAASAVTYVPSNDFMCPHGPHLVCRDFNAMPQRMWRTDRQTWSCEGCGAPMIRTYTPAGGWSPWHPAAPRIGTGDG